MIAVSLSAMAFSITDISCQRGYVPVLSHVSFSIARGEAIILRGPNGIGKTTLLRTIAGLCPSTKGEISFSPDQVAYAGHADGLKAQLTAAENLEFWAGIYGTGSIDSAVDAFDLTSLLSRRANDLSAGQKRRLSLARLCLTGRPLWAFDEPTVSLDSENVERFASTVKTHLANGGLALIATHIDLGLEKAKAIDLSQFKAKPEEDTNPFLDEALA